jgi:glyceraldehyde-3-phosphate dehydrogenase/erythrose-4-phosphate dehydrogenase
MRIGINGMGRIARLALRAAMGGIYRAADDPRGENRLDVVHINELRGGAATTAHLLEFDSIHGRWRESFSVKDDRAILIGNRRIGLAMRQRRVPSPGPISAAMWCSNAPVSSSSWNSCRGISPAASNR